MPPDWAGRFAGCGARRPGSLVSRRPHGPQWYVSGNLLIYYQEGNPRASVAPDVFVVLGANSADRCTYLLWEEPKAPDFVLEITSCSTRHEDQVIKRDLYRSLGVREYFLFDPTNDYLKPPLQGLERQARLEAESLLAQETAARKAAEARVAEIEARLRQAGGDDPAGGQPGST